jgi:hypothetical protein
MAFRTGALTSVQSTTVAQPFWGSWITAVVSGTLASATTSPITLTLGTATTSGNDATNLFQPGDPVWLIDPTTGFHAEACRIQSIATNNVTLGPQNDSGNYVTRFPHVAGVYGTGTFILLNSDINNFFFQYEDGGTGPFIYLGNRYNFSPTSGRITKLAKVAALSQPFYFNATENFFGSPFRVSELWILGSNVGDTYTPSLGVL